MANENVDGIDLYADVDDFGPDQEYHDVEMYDMVPHRLSESYENVSSWKTPKYSAQYSRQSSFGGKRFSLYVANLTWWTTDNDLTEAIASLGISDLLEIKFHENRVNGQSKGFATVTVSSEMSSKILLDKLSKREIHGQQVVVTQCTPMALKQFDTSAAKKEPPPMSNGQQPLPPPLQQHLRLRPPPHQQILQQSTLLQQQPPPPAGLTTRPGQPPTMGQPPPNHFGPLLGGPPQPSRILLPAGPNTALPPPSLTGVVGGAGGMVAGPPRPFNAAAVPTSPLQPPSGPQLAVMNSIQPGPPHQLQLVGGPSQQQPQHRPQLRAPPAVGMRMSASGMEMRGSAAGFQQPPPVALRPPVAQVVVQQGQQHLHQNLIGAPGMVALHPQQQQQQPQQQQQQITLQHGLLPNQHLTFQNIQQQPQQPQHIFQQPHLQQPQHQLQHGPQGEGLGRQVPMYQTTVDPFRERASHIQPAYHGAPIPPSSSSSSLLSVDPYPRERERSEREHVEKERHQQHQQPQYSPPSREQVKNEQGSSSSSQQQQQSAEMQEFEDVLQRNKSVSSSAISRAVQDASAGEYASAIETLVTAISLIKQSKIANDDRCKILISSLQDTLHGIEDKSYGSKSTRSDHRRSRSPRDRSSTKVSSRHRSRSREREYRDRSSRDKERYYDKYDNYKESSYKDRDYKDRDYKDSGRDYKDYKESRSGRH